MPSVQAPASWWFVPVPVSVTTLPDVPVTLHFPKVWVVVPRAMVWATVLVEASSVNWLLPLMVSVDDSRCSADGQLVVGLRYR
jgi:hypothetical protein